MEKFGLFDLIDKFNAVANGKNDFSKPQPNTPQKPLNNGASHAEKVSSSILVDPKLSIPPQYAMNAKLYDFCKKHDETSMKIHSQPKKI